MRGERLGAPDKLDPPHSSLSNLPSTCRSGKEGRAIANLVLSFAELLAGAVILDAAIKGDSIANVIQGKATSHPLAGSSGSSAGQAAAGGGGASSAAAGTYINPVPGASSGRIDQGVDYSLGPAGFVAPGRSKILNVSSGGGWGNEFVTGQLLDGPLAGKVWYIAEAAKTAPGIVVGKIVSTGEQIVPQGSSTGGAIEAGWANSAGTLPFAQDALTGASDQSRGALTAGYSFSSFVHALGGVPGVFQGAGQALAGAITQAFSSGSETGLVPFA